MTQRSSRWPVAQKLTKMTASLPWMQAAVAVCLCVLSLCGVARAGSTSAIGVDQFAPDSLLSMYSVYASDSIYMPNQSGTANGGYFGSGGGVDLLDNIYMRSPYYSAGRNFYLGNNAGQNVDINGKFNISGDLVSGNSAKYDSVIQVAGTIQSQGNDVYYKNSIYAGNVKVTGARTNFGAPVNVQNSFDMGSFNSIMGAGAYVNMAGASGVSNATPGATINYGVAYVPPMTSPLIRTQAQLPGYAISGLDTLANSGRKDFNVGGNGESISLMHTATGVSTLNVFKCTENLGAAYCHGDTLLPGYYGSLTFNTANGEALLIGEGFYYFDKISLQAQGQIIATQPNGKRTFVYSQGSMTAGGSNALIAPEGALNASGYGTGTGHFLGGTMMLLGGTDITIPSDLTIWATISAPHGDVHLNNQVRIYGQVFGKRILGDNNIDFGQGAYIPFNPKPPKITISSSGDSVPEADTTYYVTLTLSEANAFPVSFTFTTSDTMITAQDHAFHAVAGTNYVVQKDTVITIPEGKTSVNVPFTIKWDKVFTGNLNFYLHFSVPQNGVFKLGAGVIGDSANVWAPITILDKDRPPTIRVSDVSQNEGNLGSDGKPTNNPFNFKVAFADSANAVGSYSGTVNRDITFKWIAVDGTAKASDGDYDTVAAGIGTIPKGSSSTNISVNVHGDNRYENNETFKVIIDSASLVGQAAVSAGAQKKLVGIGTILNDDLKPLLALSDTSYLEGNPDSKGGVDTVRYLRVYLKDPNSTTGARLDSASAPELPISYSWATADGTATIADNDYAAASGASAVKAYRLTDTIQVTTKKDSRYEPDETFTVKLTPGTNAGNPAAVVATDTIKNDDNQPVVKITVDSAAGFHEGNSGDRHVATFTVTLCSQAPGNPPMQASDIPTGGVSFNWSTVNGTAIGRAIGSADSDFVVVTNAKKILTKATDTLQVVIIGDNKYEKDENFSVQIDSASLTNAAVTNANKILTASAIILNDDSLPRLKVVADSNVHEGASGQHPLATFTVSLTDPSGKPLSLADAPEVPVGFTWSTSDGVGLNAAKSSGTGIADTDFVAVQAMSGAVDSGKVSTTFAVKINGDGVYEGDESFGVNVNPGANAARTGPFSVNDTIIDDDAPPTLKLSGVILPEGNQGTTTPFNFGAKFSYKPSLPATIYWHTVDGTATTADGDYQPKGSVVKDTMTTVAAGIDTVALTVIVNGDNKLEPDESFSIKVDSVKVGSMSTQTMSGGVKKDTAVGTILNDDARPFIQVKPAISVKEGTPPQPSPNVLKFPVIFVDSLGRQLTSPLGVGVSYSWSTVDSLNSFLGANSGNHDFTPVSLQTRTIAAGQPLTDTLVVTITPDSTYEADESFRVKLSGVVNADTTASSKTASPTGNTTAVGTILNDDVAPVLSVRDTFVTEPANSSSPDSNLVFTYRLSAPSGLPVIFNSWTQGVTATPGDDFVALPATHKDTIPAGTIVWRDTVKVHGDAIYEGPETLRLLVNPVDKNVTLANDSLGTKGVIGTILDEDHPPVLHVDSVTVGEGATATFTVTLVDRVTGKVVTSGQDVTFNWTTADSTAKAGSDYVKGTGVGAIPKGASSTTLPVVTKRDGIANEDTLFYKVILSNPVNATVGDTGLGGILDKDPIPTLSIDTVDTVEGKPLVFHLKLSGPSAKPISLVWSTSEDGIPPKLQARSSGTDPDYVGIANASYRLRAGILDTTLSVTTIDNVVDDPDTLFLKVPLSAATAKDASLFTFGNKVGYGGIIDNDLPPSVTINDTSVQEPADSGAIAYAVSTIHLSSKSSQSVTVYFHTYPGTAHSSGSSTESPDYKDTTGTLLLLPGQLDSTIKIMVYGDNIYEGNEFFYVKIDSVKNADTGTKTRGTVTILDNDVAPTISVGAVSTSEPGLDASGNLLPPTAVEIPVHLSHSSGLPVTFTWSTHDTGNTTPINMRAKHTKGSLVPSDPDTLPDYDSTGGAIIIPAGVTDTFLTVYIHADFMTNEGLKTNSSPSDTSGKEIYTVVLSGIQNAFLGTIGVDTIIDWNHKPSLAVIKSTAVTEGDSAVFHVMLNTPSATDIVFTYKTIGVTATPGLDYEDTYETTARSFTIRSGVVDTFIKVKTIDDAIQEDTETFKVKILTATDANIVDSTAIGTILDNDGPPLVSIGNDTVTEPATAGASVVATFKVHFSAPSGLPMTVHWATVDSTAQSKSDPLDYQGVGGSIVMPAGQTDTTVSVTVFGDSLYEGPEYFKVHLYDLTNVALSKDSVGIGTILDSDLPPLLSITDDTVREGTTAKFTVSLNHESGLPVIFHWHTVQLGTTHGYAIAGKDYKDTAGVDTIAAGKLSIDIPVRTLADTITGEGPETFNLQYTIDSVRPTGSSANLISATGDTIGVGTILDTNSLPSLSINSVGPLTEGKDQQAVFTVTLSGGVSAVDVNIHYTTQDGTAKAGKRYVASSGIVTLPAGQTSVTIPVALINDTIRESHPETFNVILDSTDSAKIVQPIGVATIIDTGDFPHLIVGNADTVSEGTSAVFPVTLRGGTTDTVKIYWHTVDGSKTWNSGEPARRDSDYVAATDSLILLPGQNQSSISIKTIADNVWEPTEVFAIKIDSIVGADTAKGKALLSPTDSLAKAWIRDVGDVPTVKFLSADTSVYENAAGSVPVVVGLSRPASVDIKVLVPRTPGTVHEATYGVDYTVSGLVNDTIVIPAHDSMATFKVHVVDDSIDEYDETADWKLVPFAPISLGGKSEYRLTILDNDSPSVVSFVRDTQWIKEGASVNVVAHLNRPSGKDIEAWYRTSGTATPGVDDDLRPDAHEVLFFKAGDTAASVLVHTVDDSIYEGTESMVFTLDSTVNASLGSPKVDSVFIQDNDSVPVVSFVVADTTVKEDVGTITLRIHLDHPAAAPIHVWIKAHAMPLDATKGIYPATLLSNANKNDTLVSTSNQADVALNGDSTYVVVIPSLDTSVNFSFKVLDDGRVEPTETFRLGITSEEANPKDPDSLQVHILDNDKNPAVKITSPADSAHLGKKNLDASGKVPVTWTVDGTVQTPYDTLLPEGKSVIRKSYTDIWGNVGSDTITVWLDTTPPTVKIDSISRDGGKTWIAVDTPWVNVPGVLVKWHSIDDGVTTWHQDSTKLTDTLNTISRCFEDAVGNKGCNSGTVGLDTTAPKVWITTPPNGSQWPLGCVGVTYYVQDMGTTTRHDTTYCSDVLGPQTITTPTYTDRAGNTAKGTTNIVMVPNTPSSAKYIDSDGDGRIDEVIVQFPAKVVGNLPSFEISYGAPGANTISSSSVTYGSSSQAGNYYVVKGDTLRNASGAAVKVVEGRPVVGSDGQQLVDSTGKPVFASTGTPLLDAHGKQVRDTNGIPLWVAASSSAVDSSVLVVKLVPPFPYGWTSSSVTNLGVIKGTNAAVVNGQTVKQSWTDTFDIKDGVAPVIEKSEIHRTESYSGKDTLWIYPSEPLTLKSKDGSGIFQVSLDSGKTWIDVKVSSISSTGALQIILDLGSGVKPGVMVRFGDSVSDAAGNVVNHSTDTTKVVVQGPKRPDLIDVTQPSGVIQVNPSTGNSAQKGGFAFVASTGDTSTASMKTYQPGQGYSNVPQDLCPDYNQCSVTSLYINKPSSVQMYVYDQIGTYIASTRFIITEQDIKTIQKDKLDRTQLKVLWNLRDTKGEQVVSGIYLIRFVVRSDNFTTVNGSLENHVIKIGVKVN